MNESQLVRAIKAHIEKGDKAKDKAEQHYIAAGQYLLTLKKLHTGNWADWEKLLKTKVGICTGRASELMQIADGRKTVESVRAGNAAANKRLRDRRSSSRDEENAEPPVDPTAGPVSTVDTRTDTKARKQPAKKKSLSAQEGDDNVAPPEVIRKNILDTVEGHKAVARTCKKWAKVASFDQATKAEVGTAIGELITIWQSVQRVLAQEVTPADKVVVRNEKLRAAENLRKAEIEMKAAQVPTGIDAGSVSKPQRSIAAPSPETAPAVDPWDELDIPDYLRRAPKAAPDTDDQQKNAKAKVAA